ncbi:MAG: DUF4861 domain-containing protein [Dysgonamonadaceae bacterium]|nr:DUF4861 domain-containing protein [Dysgonamonadaceae bacterium]
MKPILFLFVAAPLFAGCSSSELALTVENASSLNRENEMVEVPWDELQKKWNETDAESIIVTDQSAKQIPYQWITEGVGSISKLIFLASVKAGAKAVFKIKKGKSETFATRVYGRLVPERKDDFAWENNRVAFRIYGPALEATGEISNGMDFWAKNTDSLVIDKWYKNDLAGIASYHEDHGEGLDFYKVGRTLGLGMTAPYIGDSLRLGNNFIAATILDRGPLRLTFELKYKPYAAGSKTITETRVISLDAYSRLNKIEQTFVVSDGTDIPVATGIVMQQPADYAADVIFSEPQKGIMAYELQPDSANGTIYTGVINPASFSEIKTGEGHLLGINNCVSGSKYVYYAGGAWSKAGFRSFEEWVGFLVNRQAELGSPLKVRIR